MSANVQSMFYAGKEKPWHGFGKQVEKELTSADAIAAAGLDWRVEKEQMFLKGDVIVPGAFATVRQDTKAILGTVGNGYTVLQNRDAFALSDAIVKEKLAIYHTAGALGVGEKIWLLAKLPGHIKVKGEDVTEKFLLFWNPHTGHGSAQMMITPIRVVCQNTLNAAIRGCDNKVSVRHTANMGDRVAEIRKTLGLVNEFFDQFEQAAQVMAGNKVSLSTFGKFVKKTGLVPDEKELSSRAKNIMEEVSALFDGKGKGSTLIGSKGTAWGAYNAIVEYVDYKRGGDEDRGNSLLFGSGAKIKQAAFELAVAGVRS